MVLIVILAAVLSGDKDSSFSDANPIETYDFGTSADTDLYLNISHSQLESAIDDLVQKELIEADNLPLSYQYANAVVKAFSYEIVDVGTAGKAELKVTYVDVLKLADSFGDVIDVDAFYSFCIQQIDNKTAPVVEDKIVVECILTEDNGIIELVDNIDLADALTGGAASEYIKMMEGREN